MKTETTTPEFRITEEKFTVVKDIVLEGVETLKANRVTTTYEVKRKVKNSNIIYKKEVNEVVEPLSFDLLPVTPEELIVYRRIGVPSFVLKKDSKLYYASIPDNINFYASTILGAHRCALYKMECRRLSAACDPEGCAKVRDGCKHIERYPWITDGYESFNTKDDSFVVVNCLHYEKIPPREKISIMRANYLKQDLNLFLYD